MATANWLKMLDNANNKAASASGNQEKVEVEEQKRNNEREKNEDITKFHSQDAGQICGQSTLPAVGKKDVAHTKTPIHTCVCVCIGDVHMCALTSGSSIDQPNEGPTFA